MVIMKRSREEMENNTANINMAKCLILLSLSGGGDHHHHEKMNKNNSPTSSSSSMITYSPSSGSPTIRVFECKTCNRQFQSFQALGGHRASHKKPRFTDSTDDGNNKTNQTVQMKPKSHECSICGSEFAIGQALGGHMRRHRAAMNPTVTSSLSSQILHSFDNQEQKQQVVPVLKRSNSTRRVLCLDLNLSPPGGNDFDHQFPSTTTVPMIHCFI